MKIAGLGRNIKNKLEIFERIGYNTLWDGKNFPFLKIHGILSYGRIFQP